MTDDADDYRAWKADVAPAEAAALTNDAVFAAEHHQYIVNALVRLREVRMAWGFV